MEEMANYPVDNEGDEEENVVQDEEEESQEQLNEEMSGDEEMGDGGQEGEGEEGEIIGGGPVFEDADPDENFEGEAEDGEEVDPEADVEGEEGFPNNELDDEEGGVEEGEGHLIETENGGEGDGEVPPADSEEVAAMQLLLPDSESLYDPSLGFEPEANIKSPMVGFSSTYQDYFFPLIDSQSGILFEIVQEVERAVYKSNEDLLRGIKEPVAIPTSRLVLKVGGPEIRIRMLDPSEPLISVESTSPSDSPPQSGSSSATPTGWQKTKTSAESMQMEKQITPAEKAFSQEKLAKLMVPFDFGWKREIVIRSHGGGASKKLGDVYYFSPDGIKYRSSKQVAIYLNKLPGNMSVENFSFAKARVSYDSDHESVRAAQGGRGLNPVKNKLLQKQQIGGYSSRGGIGSLEDDENSNTANGIGDASMEGSMDSSDADSIVKGRGGRRSINPPKRYATAEFIPEPSKRAKMSQKAQDKEGDSYSRGGGMQMGMLHPKYQEEKTGEQMLQEFRARRGRPPSKGPLPGSPLAVQHHYATHSPQQQQQQQNSQNRGRSRQREDGPMFGISALTQGASFSNFSEGSRFSLPPRRNIEDQLDEGVVFTMRLRSGRPTTGTIGPAVEWHRAVGTFHMKLRTSWFQKKLEYGSSADSEGYEGDTSLDMDEDGRVGGGGDKGELLPCSIRCPGMTGEIPTLQCKRCLCLYHPGCLGLPNQPYRNFYCSNCEGDDSSSGGGGSATSSGIGSPVAKSRNNVVLMKGGIRVMKRSEPPPLIHLNAAVGAGGMAKFSQGQGGQGMRRILPKMPLLQGGRPQQGPGQGQMMMGRGATPGQGFQRLAPPALIRPGMQMGGGIRRGRGRPPRMAMNSGHPHPGQGQGQGQNMNRGSVTITPISIASRGRGGGQQGQGPQIPRLQPMSGTFMRGGIRKSGPGMMHQGQSQQQYSQMGGGGQGQQQMMRSRGGGSRPQFVVNPHQQMQLLRRGGLAPRQRLPGAGVRLPGLRGSPIFRMDGDGRVMSRTPGSGLVTGQPNSASPLQFSGSPQFQRYAQSVVTINQKKYLALPKNSSGASTTAAAPPSLNRSSQFMMRSANSSTNAHAPANPLLAQRRAEVKAQVAAAAMAAAAAAGVCAEEVSSSEYDNETSEELTLSEETEIGDPVRRGTNEKRHEKLQQFESEYQREQAENGCGPTESASTVISTCSSSFFLDSDSVSDVNAEVEQDPKKVALMRVLSLVPDTDKIRLRSVSKLWRSAIDEPAMWTTLSLAGIRVKNWTILQKFVLRHQVTELDTRGALIADMEEFWQQLMALDYSCSSVASGVTCHLTRVLVSQEVSEWGEGSLLKEFRDTGSAQIDVV